MSTQQTTPSLLLAMSSPPYWHCGRTVVRRSLDQIVALLPAIVMATWNWGLPAFRVIALSVVVCVLVEALACKIMERRQTIADLTAVVTGICFAFLLPAAAPWWLVATGAAVAMIFGKMLFGGLGDNPVSTPIVGWAILFVSYPLFMDPNIMQINTTFEEPLALLKYLGVERASQVPFADLVMGRQIGALGASQVGALFVGGSYLVMRGVVRWQIVLGMLLGVVVPFAMLQMITGVEAISPIFHLLTGSTLFCAFFIATDSNVAPTHGLAMFLYGLTCGVIVFLIREFGSYTDGAPFAVLVASLLTPYFDLIRPKPFGVR